MKRFNLLLVTLTMTLSGQLMGAVCTDFQHTSVTELGNKKVASCNCNGKYIYLQVSQLTDKKKEMMNYACENNKLYKLGDDSNGGLAYSTQSPSELNQQSLSKITYKHKTLQDQYDANQDELKKLQESRKNGTYDYKNYFDSLDESQQSRVTTINGSIDQLKTEKEKMEADFLSARKDGTPIYIKENGKWQVHPEVKLTNKERKKAQREVNDFNKVSQNYDTKIAERSDYVGNIQEDKLNKEGGSFEDALNANEGDMIDAYNTRSAEIKKQYKRQCLEYQSCEKNPKHPKCVENKNADIKPSEMGFPTEEKGNNNITEVPKEELEAMSKDQERCEKWASYQLKNNTELKDAEVYIVDKQNKLDNELEIDESSPGAGSKSENMQTFLAQKLEEGGFGIDECNKLYDKDGTSLVDKGSAAYLLVSTPGKAERMSQASARKITDPLQCDPRKEEDRVFDLERSQLFTDFRTEPLKNITEEGKLKICAGMAFQPVEQNSRQIKCDSWLENGHNICVQNWQQSSASPGYFNFDDPSLKYAELNYLNQDTCKKLFYNKFKQCVGLPYYPVSYLYEGQSPAAEGQIPEIAQTYVVNEDQFEVSNEEVEQVEEVVLSPELKELKGQCVSENEAAADPTGTLKSKKCQLVGTNTLRHNKVGSEVAQRLQQEEVYHQWNVCFAFRELSREQAEFFGDLEIGQEVVSLDGRLRCVRAKPWTQDYRACRGMVLTYNGFIAGEQVKGVASQGWSMVRQNQIREETANEMGNAGKDDDGQINPDKAQTDQVNAGINAQQKTYKHLRDKEHMNLGFHSAQAGTLTTLLAKYPTPNKFSRKCESEDGNALDAECTASWSMNLDESGAIKYGLFPNQQVKRMMWGQVMQAGAKAALAALKANAYKSRIGDLEKYKSAFNDVNKDNVKKTESDYMVGYCSLNPTAPGCRPKGPRVQGNSEFSNGAISMNGNTGGQYGFNNNEGSFGEFEEGDDSSAAQKRAIADLNGVMDQDSAGSFNNDFKKVGAGKFSRSGPGSGGAGGSGGGGGGGGSAYNGAGAGGGAAGGNNSAFGGVNSKVSYKAGGGFKSGKGRSSGKKKSANPFSSLFGNKKSRAVASQVNDIAPKHSGLFDKISKRYGKLQKDNRLLNLK